MKQKSPSQKIVPLKDGQHPVTALPKFTTDLPFFYLTKQKELLKQIIEFEDIDSQGRPIRWRVTPNSNQKIGAPGIEAHEVMTRLLQPAIDSNKTFDGNLPAIVPLGGVRECLRIIGWKEGGWTARDMLKAIRQIGSAWCEVDFWMPTTKMDAQGRVLFRRIKGEFSRMSIWAIGSKHVTEEDLEQGNVNFDFDLDDTVYVQLHPLEVEMQRFQPKRYTDNEYLFSVDPSARRWYELIAPKIFGVIKHGGEYCEYLYSWYIKHHPTMKRFNERYRVVYQHTRLIKAHIALGYVKKLEFRAIKEPGKEVDYVIRCYVGETAKTSVSNVLGHIYKKPLRLVKGKSETLEPAVALSKTEPGNREQGSDPSFQSPTGDWTDEQLQLIRQLNEQFSITMTKASDLVRDHGEEVKQQLIALPYRENKPKNLAGWLIAAVEQNYELPQAYREAVERETEGKALKAKRAKREAEEAERQRLVFEHEAYRDQAVDAYLAEHAGDLPARVEAKKKELLAKHHSMYSKFEEDAFDSFALRNVRSDISTEIGLLTFDVYYEQHRSRGEATP